MLNIFQNLKCNIIFSIFYLLSLFSLLALQFTIPVDGQIYNADGRDYIVDLNGDGDFLNIQEAINQSKSGDNIIVNEGIYHTNIIISKRIQLIGRGSDKTIIISEKIAPCIEILSDSCTVRGFRIEHSNPIKGEVEYYSGIVINSNYNIIEDCELNNNNFGIAILSGKENIIRNNICMNQKQHGISIRQAANDNEVLNCIAKYNTIGIGISGTNNIAYNSSCIENEKGIFINNDKNIVRNCKIKSNNEYGLSIYEASDNIIENNEINSNGRYDIFLDRGAHNNKLRNNTGDVKDVYYEEIGYVIAFITLILAIFCFPIVIIIFVIIVIIMFFKKRKNK